MARRAGAPSEASKKYNDLADRLIAGNAQGTLSAVEEMAIAIEMEDHWDLMTEAERRRAEARQHRKLKIAEAHRTALPSLTSRVKALDPATVTLAEAKAWLRARVYSGAECPCCTQYAKVYRRRMTCSQAYVLILIYRYFETTKDTGWLYLPTFLSKESKVAAAVRGGDYAKLVHWGLLVEKPDAVREDGSTRVGLYRITDLGCRFVEDKERVRLHIWLYDEKLLGREDGQTTSIQEALGRRFDYGELMGLEEARLRRMLERPDEKLH